VDKINYSAGVVRWASRYEAVRTALTGRTGQAWGTWP
jgi:hypothetical protein